MAKEIQVEELVALIDRGAKIIDVRENEESSDGSIPGSKNWPLSEFGLFQREISSSRPTIFYCKTGMRSAKAAEIAESWTGQPIYSLSGGFLTYRDQVGEDSDESREDF